MRFWTAHVRANAEPVLLREGFAWGALVFGPFWLAAHRAWIPAAFALAADLSIGVVAESPVGTVLSVALAVLLGLSGYDLVRWSLQQQGFLLAHVLAARTEPEALGRLLTARPDLAARFMPPERAR